MKYRTIALVLSVAGLAGCPWKVPLPLAEAEARPIVERVALREDADCLSRLAGVEPREALPVIRLEPWADIKARSLRAGRSTTSATALGHYDPDLLVLTLPVESPRLTRGIDVYVAELAKHVLWLERPPLARAVARWGSDPAFRAEVRRLERSFRAWCA